MRTRNDILGSLMMDGFYRGQWWPLDDDMYSPISAGFVLDAHREWVRSLPPELVQSHDIGGGKTEPCPLWRSEVWDCDNQTRDFGAFVNRCMALDAVKNATERGNAAIGLLKYEHQPGVLHAVNWFVDYAGSVHVFDVATRSLDHLVASQIRSIYEGESL